ncbi:hypothetical protein TWF696_004710 [Orbilia brochopaga]|uniref:Uncharacterized protein n=1 Tax=Orbilia brochopaga TaxID=3140254 RepID=A0AAV9V1U5_9PEZI
MKVSVIVSVAASISAAIASPVAYGDAAGPAAPASTTPTLPVTAAATAAYYRVRLHHPAKNGGEYGYPSDPARGNNNGGNNGNTGANAGGSNGNTGGNAVGGNTGGNVIGGNTGGNVIGGNTGGNVIGGSTGGNTIGGNTGGNVVGGSNGGNTGGGNTGGNVIGGGNGGGLGGLGGLGGGAGNPLGGLLGGGIGGGLLSPVSLILGAVGSHNGFMLFRKAFDLLSEKACDFALNEAARFADFWVLVPAQSVQELLTAWDEVAATGNGFQGVSPSDVTAVQQRVDLTKQVTGFIQKGTFEGVQPGEFKTSVSYLRCRQLSETNPDAFVQVSPENPANPLGGLPSGGLTSALPLGGLPL